MNFISALIKNSLQPARRIGAEASLYSPGYDPAPPGHPESSNVSKSQTIGMEADPQTTSTAEIAYENPAPGAQTDRINRPSEPNIHSQKSANKENVEAVVSTVSSSIDNKKIRVAAEAGETGDQPAQMQQLETEEYTDNRHTPYLDQFNSEPNQHPGIVQYQENNGPDAQPQHLFAQQKPIQTSQQDNKTAIRKSDGSNAVPDTHESFYSSTSTPQNIAFTPAKHATEASEQKSSKPVSSQPTANNADNIAVRPARKVQPPASSILQELSNARHSKPPKNNAGPKQNDVPQVRIGSINVLIDDQAAAKPRQSSSSKKTGPSSPFGLRGL